MSQSDDIDVLQKRLSEAIAREAAVMSRLQELASRLPQLRMERGNPFFYSGGRYDRPEHAAKSVAHFTGYDSHAPALALLQEYAALRRDIATVQVELRNRGALPE